MNLKKKIKNNLVIDIGNTRTKFYIFNNNIEIEKFIFFSKNETEIHAKLLELEFDKAIISTTINLPSFYNEITYIELDDKTKIPLTLNYKTPTSLGSDRIALSVGASKKFPKSNCLIIGTGTCITIDFVNYKNEYLGGAISPGLTMRLQSLHTFTAQLPLIKPNREEKEFSLIGKSTKESIESGVFNGTFAEIDGIIDRYKEIYKDLTVVLTGGDQEIFDRNLKSDIFAISNLQAIGLNRILNYNAEI